MSRPVCRLDVLSILLPGSKPGLHGFYRLLAAARRVIAGRTPGSIAAFASLRSSHYTRRRRETLTASASLEHIAGSFLQILLLSFTLCKSLPPDALNAESSANSTASRQVVRVESLKP